ncbi:hypothetical protein GOB92_29305, partial [Sinorhizobium meliloti]|nr:hypothetical protein [Sinorhizobium meliloti]
IHDELRHILQAVTPQECAAYFKEAGYRSRRPPPRAGDAGINRRADLPRATSAPDATPPDRPSRCRSRRRPTGG